MAVKKTKAPAKPKPETVRLIPDPENLRVHPEENRDLIGRSLDEVGPLRSIGVDKDGIIRAGNGVYSEAVKRGMKIKLVDAEPDELVAVRRLDLEGDAAKRAALYDNAASDKSHFDALLIKELAERESSLLEGILTDNDLARIMAQMEAETNKIIALDYDSDISENFSAGTQFKQEGYEVTLTLTDEQYNSEEFKKALSEFCLTHNLAYKVKTR